MRYNPDYQHRRSLRLRGYDYSQQGAYFVTICVQNKECTFGEVVESRIHLNEAGEVIDDLWRTLPERFPHLSLDEYILMPNHIHGVLVIESEIVACSPQHEAVPATRPTVGNIVRAFKAVATHTLRKNGMAHFSWQRDFYEHIVRNEEDLHRIRTYIVNNPSNWQQDTENPTS